MRHRRALLLLLLAVACVPDEGRPDRTMEAYLELLAAEDARPRTAADGLGVLLRGTGSESAFLRQVAVRGLGRLERGGLVHEIVELLGDPVPAVRAEAANALAQAVHRGEGAAAVEPLLSRVRVERDPLVRASLARSLGRLRVEPRDRGRIVEGLRTLASSGDGLAPSATLVGVALGFESLVRGSPGSGLSASAARLLQALSEYRPTSAGAAEDAARIRRLAISTLAAARRLNGQQVEGALRDDDPGVRAVAARHLDVIPPGARVELIRRALADPWPQTRQEAVRQIERLPRTDLLCRYLIAVVEQESSEAGRILALDALADPCPDPGTQVATLAAQAARLEERGNAGWQVASHALRSLAAVAPDSAAALLPDFARHSSPFVRAHAAHAAARLGSSETLRALASDPHPNVRVAALPALARFQGAGLRSLLLEQLEHDDPQLLMTASALLASAGTDSAVAAGALGAFQRISRERRETWRDARRALLNLVSAAGDTALVPALRPFLRDYDPAVAQDVAGLLETWTGRPYAAQPQPLPRLDLPSAMDLARMERSAVLLHMRSGGAVRIELLPYQATTNAYRFLRLASEGWFDGLTFHRWAPLFVIQGGSPGANEYQGDAAYTRDETGLEVHWRGTVGVSTRGRDTGDGQIFVNLVDNVRLNHDYTVFGVVTEGMDVVDDVLEGAVIERAEVVTAGS